MKRECGTVYTLRKSPVFRNYVHCSCFDHAGLRYFCTRKLIKRQYTTTKTAKHLKTNDYLDVIERLNDDYCFTYRFVSSSLRF